MFKQLFNPVRRRNRAIADAIYIRIVAAARQPVPYSDWLVPDTPLGRFEMVGLHIYLFLRRIRGEGEAADALGQELTDTFFQDVDHSLRELGIGDMGIPKRMKTLSRMFYGRTRSYDQALDARDQTALTAAVARNVRPETPEWPQAESLAAYLQAVSDDLATQRLDDLLSGEVRFLPAK
ncbi:MAG: ubiquinol-cytochrome C chaperone [Mesorhizobium sp.]|nr:ubiquinol-cytochrome C chaperone family protein [Mesorhizobium sp.]MCO5159537.1 ubiquinol-cytochrome C chaperone [Mesorhizobium sp.]